MVDINLFDVEFYESLIDKNNNFAALQRMKEEFEKKLYTIQEAIKEFESKPDNTKEVDSFYESKYDHMINEQEKQEYE